MRGCVVALVFCFFFIVLFLAAIQFHHGRAGQGNSEASQPASQPAPPSPSGKYGKAASSSPPLSQLDGYQYVANNKIPDICSLTDEGVSFDTRRTLPMFMLFLHREIAVERQRAKKSTLYLREPQYLGQNAFCMPILPSILLPHRQDVSLSSTSMDRSWHSGCSYGLETILLTIHFPKMACLLIVHKSHASPGEVSPTGGRLEDTPEGGFFFMFRCRIPYYFHVPAQGRCCPRKTMDALFYRPGPHPACSRDVTVNHCAGEHP
ncbi:hypothetical protein BX666DRAFT_1431206 [Dichotomocladium elegans]|nr:hypothetical protein BX666DRAFT_1431206 [Dichotomocladium elegans]